MTKKVSKSRFRTVPTCQALDNGTRVWHLRGQRHREDGPAVEYANGTNAWFRHGDRHREDGPAVEYADGSKEWWLNDQLHREDGPAVEYSDGQKGWWFCGQYYTKPEWLREVLKGRPLTAHQCELLAAFSENWAGTPEMLHETVTNLAD